MAITLAEASVGRADKVTQEVIDELRRGSSLLNLLTFDDTVSPGVGGSTMAYGYLQVLTPSTAAGRAINAEYTANEAKKQKKVAYLKIFGGSSQIDRVIQAASGSTEIAFQIQQKTIATKNHFHYTAINGSSTNNAVDFDGLSKLLTGKSTECNVGNDATVINLSTSAQMDSNYKSFLDMLDEFLATVNGKPDLLLGNSKLIARMTGVARRAGYLTQTEDSFGRKVPGYNGIPFMDLENYYNGSNTVPCVPIYTTGSGNDAVTGLTDLYAVKFGLDAFHGASLTGDSVVHTYLPNLNEPGAVKKAEVEMVAAVVLKDTTKCGVLRNIKVA